MFDLGFKLAIADNELLNIEIETIFSFICNAFHLTQPEKDRLVQRGLLYKQTWDVDIEYLIPKLKFNPVAVDLICDFLIAVAAADNIIKVEEYKLLLSFYSQLGLTEQKLQERLNLLRQEETSIVFQTSVDGKEEELRGSKEQNSFRSQSASASTSTSTSASMSASSSMINPASAPTPITDKDNVYQTICVYNSSRQRSLPISELSLLINLPLEIVEKCVADLLQEKRITRWGNWLTPIATVQKPVMPSAVSAALGTESLQESQTKEGEAMPPNEPINTSTALERTKNQKAEENQKKKEFTIVLDPKKIAAIQENTAKSQYYLFERLSSDNYEDNSDDNIEDYSESKNKHNLRKNNNSGEENPQERNQIISMSDTEEIFSEKGDISERLARILIKQSKWTELALKRVFEPFNLRVSNALDIVNEWTDLEFGDYLIDTDNYSVEAEIANQIKSLLFNGSSASER